MARQKPGSFHLLPYFLKRFDQAGRQYAFEGTNLEEWRRWRRRLRRRLRTLTGLDTMQTAPLQPKITAERKFPGYTRRRIEITTEPGVVMPLFVLIPTEGEPPFPVVLAPHGHASGGKTCVAGDRRDDPLVAEAIKNYNYNYGEAFARAGFITFCPDARGFGERLEGAAPHAICRPARDRLQSSMDIALA